MLLSRGAAERERVEEPNIPAEVIRHEKRRRVTQDELEEKELAQQKEAVLLPHADILNKKPKDRTKWLFRAVELMQRRLVKADFIYDVITDKDFATGIRGKTAGSMLVQLEQSRSAATGWAQLVRTRMNNNE